jgi:hypothetical protein
LDRLWGDCPLVAVDLSEDSGNSRNAEDSADSASAQ